MKELSLGLAVTFGAIAGGVKPAIATETPDLSPVAEEPTPAIAQVSQPENEPIDMPQVEVAEPHPEFAEPVPEPSSTEPPNTNPAPQLHPTSDKAVAIAPPETVMEFVLPERLDAQPEKPASVAQTEDGVQDKIQQLEQQQQQLRQEIDTLKQQLSAPKETPTSVVQSIDDQPQSLTFSTQVLFLKPKVSNQLDFAVVQSGETNPLAIDGKLSTLDYDTDTGVRYSLTYRPPQSAWDITSSHLSVESDDRKSVTRPGIETGDRSFLYSTLSAVRQNDSANTATATAKLDYDATDVEVGYNLKAGESFGLRLFTGLQFADIDQRLSATYDGRDFTNGKVKLQNDFNGVGPKLGAEMRWNLGSGLSLFGRGSAGLVFGHSRARFNETDDSDADVVANFRRDRNQTVPVIAMALGLDWTAELSKESRLSLSAGYEYQNWFNISNNIRFTDDTNPALFAENRGDLSMKGFFLKAGLSLNF